MWQQESGVTEKAECTNVRFPSHDQLEVIMANMI